jgi:hypothetical protein
MARRTLLGLGLGVVVTAVADTAVPRVPWSQFTESCARSLEPPLERFWGTRPHPDLSMISNEVLWQMEDPNLLILPGWEGTGGNLTAPFVDTHVAVRFLGGVSNFEAATAPNCTDRARGLHGPGGVDVDGTWCDLVVRQPDGSLHTRFDLIHSVRAPAAPVHSCCRALTTAVAVCAETGQVRRQRNRPDDRARRRAVGVRGRQKRDLRGLWVPVPPATESPRVCRVDGYRGIVLSPGVRRRIRLQNSVEAGHRDQRPALGAAAVASFWAAVLTEIYLWGVCSCQEILRRNGRGQSDHGKYFDQVVQSYALAMRSIVRAIPGARVGASNWVEVRY